MEAQIKILVIDDDRDFIKVFRILFSKEPYEIIEAFDGEEGLRLVREHQPDLVLLDINMPGKTGIECMKEIRERKYDFKVIAQTAYAMADEKQRCLEAGCDGYLAKPFTKTMLYECIASCSVE